MSTIQKYWDNNFDIKMDSGTLPSIQNLIGYNNSLTMVTYQRLKLNNRCIDSCHRSQRKKATMTRRRFASLSLSETPVEIKSKLAEDAKPHKILRTFSSPAYVNAPESVPGNQQNRVDSNVEQELVTNLQSRLSPLTSSGITNSLTSHLASSCSKQNISKIPSNYEGNLYYDSDHILPNRSRGLGNGCLRLQSSQDVSRMDIANPIYSMKSSKDYKGK